MSLTRRLTIIGNAVNKAETNAEPDDVAYLIRHLAFEAGLLLRSGYFKNEEQKAAIERALARVESLVKEIA
jgi:hypothetical protein